MPTREVVVGLMDKARQAAQQAAAMAQEGLAQGQAKIEALQVQRTGNELLRQLGEAFYAEQRTGGDREAVVRALAAVDQHIRDHGPINPPQADAASPGGGASGDAPASSPGGDDAWGGATDAP